MSRARAFAAVLVIAAACARPEQEARPQWPAAPPPQLAAGPELVVHTGEPWAYGKLTGRYSLVVRDSARETWRCELTPPGDARRCDRTHTWFSGPGAYSAAVVLERDARETSIATQPFRVDGGEDGIEVELTFTKDDAATGTPLRLAEVHVIRLLPSLLGVSLEQRWSPAADGSPGYLLVNHSERTLYGAGLFGNYFGHPERHVGGSWVPVRRGGFCGTVDAGKPLAPGQATGSLEGYLIGEPAPFAPGQYRYVVWYSVEGPQREGAPTTIWQSGRTYTHSSDLHVVTAPFAIPGDA